jgi:hypothetical protein
MAAQIKLVEGARSRMSASSELGSSRYPTVGCRDHRWVSAPTITDRPPLRLLFHGQGLTQRTGPAL